MAYTVTAADEGEVVKVNMAPATRLEEILQNVRTIISTPKYSVPLDRGLGLEGKFLDRPSPHVAHNILVGEVLDAIEESEPRVEVGSVTYKMSDTPGKMIPVVEVNIIADEE